MNSAVESIQFELQEGMSLAKCRKCGCMKETLEHLHSSLSSLPAESSGNLLYHVKSWLKQIEPIRYTCLGCEHCFPAVVMNTFYQTFPEVIEFQPPSCGFEVREHTWPPVPGEYVVLCEGSTCPVAVSTLASVELAEALAKARPVELCIVGKTETENIGIEKVIKNVITNPMVHVLLLTGKDSKGHYSGKTFLALWKNGVDENMRVIGSPARRPLLRNVTRAEVEVFREQVKVVDMIGCEDVVTIVEKIKELSKDGGGESVCSSVERDGGVVPISTVPLVQAKAPTHVEMDRAGYFVIIPQIEKGIITVEHYTYENRLEQVIEGGDAKSIYWTIIENGWVTRLSHAAYLGRELTKAEFAIKHEFTYVQDGATHS